MELLREEYARLPKDVDRRWYTQRIMDIVKHVKKQQDEISKASVFLLFFCFFSTCVGTNRARGMGWQVLVETRTTQREMNKLADSLKRCFTQSEEVLYKRAEKDPDFRRAYKGLVQLREVRCSPFLSLSLSLSLS